MPSLQIKKKHGHRIKDNDCLENDVANGIAIRRKAALCNGKLVDWRRLSGIVGSENIR
jgi:hypothetical protein